MAYIDKELFKQDIKMRYCNNCARPNDIKCRACHVDDMLGEIEDAPTADVVEVVRCKDCKHMRKTMSRCYCLPVYGLKQITDTDAFCSYGERRDT